MRACGSTCSCRPAPRWQSPCSFKPSSTTGMSEQPHAPGGTSCRRGTRTNVERTARLARPQDPDAFRGVLDDIRAETGYQLAAIALLHGDGTIVASSGQPSTVAAAQERSRVTSRDTALVSEWRAGREVVFVVLPCRCGLPRQAAERADGLPPAARLLVEVGLYRDSLSAPFARLRRDATISSSAALALLVSVLLIATGSGPYVRGKQLEVQMDLARQVQRDLLPAAEPRPGGLDISAECRPASHVGGDFYDIVTLPGDRMSFVLGDVSGHGVSSALLMALIHGAMSAPPWGASNEDPDCAAARLNALLLAKSSGERFASLFWCVYDPASRLLRYVNAGHLPAVWLHRASDGRWVADRLSEGGPVLGVLDGARYRTASVQTADGDLLVLFSDGITEATNDRDEPFGDDRLIAAIQRSRDLPARAISDAITSAVKVFGATRPTEDDQTLLIVRLQASAVRSPDERYAGSVAALTAATASPASAS